ncbi:MAG: hypothetical protein U9R53_04480 [Chloroflexota bacterium]|nr:hypothetical protein [Chloroflexota bacterium]
MKRIPIYFVIRTWDGYELLIGVVEILKILTMPYQNGPQNNVGR